MDNDVVIKAEGVSKKFCLNLKRSILYGTHDTFRNMFGIPYNLGLIRKNEFWALDDATFELRKGETLGIIGVNGSGKTTLLRVLTGIFPPDKGRITVKGRIGSLIAVGAGFHPHMTGRENIFLNGTILGMTKKDIQRKYESIVGFAEIGDFLDAPVATYSSGMRVRLGFAIAVHCDPDILLIDEILSVGDLSFRNKSLRYMADLRKKAKAIIFISHNLEQTRLLCDRTIILDKGKIIYDGDTYQACIRYEEMTRSIRLSSLKKDSNINFKNEFRLKQSSEEEIEFLDIGILDESNKKTEAIKMDQELCIYCDFTLKKNVEGLFFTAGVVSSKDYTSIIHVVSNDNMKSKFINLKENVYRVIARIPEHRLIPNVYLLNFAIRNESTGETYERIFSSSSFKVVSDGNHLERGIIAVSEKWEVRKIK